jgi:hypothetical protein
MSLAPHDEHLLTMPNPSEQTTPLDELDARQDEVIRQLDELNDRIEALLNECLGTRDGESTSDAVPESPARRAA